VGAAFEQVGIVAQATLGVAAILLVSLLLYRIAKNSDQTFNAQKQLAQRQRQDDEIDFLEKHFNNAMQPLRNYAAALMATVHALQSIGYITMSRCKDDNGVRTTEQIPPEEQKHIWAAFESDCERYLEKALDNLMHAATEVIASMPVAALYATSECTDSSGTGDTSNFKKTIDYARLMGMLVPGYKNMLITFRNQPFEPKMKLLKAMLHSTFLSQLFNLCTARYVEKNLQVTVELIILSLPDIDMLYKYIESLIKDKEPAGQAEEHVSEIYKQLPSFRAALATCGINPDKQWDRNRLKNQSKTSKFQMWSYGLLSPSDEK
jgi:hypothetical protein